MRWLPLLLALWACDDTSGGPAPKPEPPSPSDGPASAQPKPKPALKVDIKTRYPAADRVIAIGDVHGDIKATRAALEIGGLIDDDDNWTGGTTVLVQTGDVLDRGDDEQAILDLLLSLKKQAADAGGAVHMLHGNHELMNVRLDFRYVTKGGMRDFEDAPDLSLNDPRLARFPRSHKARAAAFLPGQAYAKKMASHPVVVVVGDAVFCHGGVLPKYAGQIEQLNREVAAWLLGGPAAGSRVVEVPDSPVWSRHFSDEPDARDCRLLEESLAKLGVKRMVVGHTPQKKISSACGKRVWRVDVGMAAHYGGTPEVLELTGGEPRPVGR